MARRLAVFSRAKLPWSLRLLLVVSFLITGQLAFPHHALADISETVIGSDSFNRANGALGAGWTDDSDGGLSIVSDQVSGNGGNSGDLRTGESYPSDQFSQLTVGSTPLSGSQWIGPAVRMQASGQSAYVGFYYWNSGSPVLMLFLRKGGNWEQLGSTYNSGALPAGTQLQVTAVGSTITLLENGVARVTATDSNLSGGAPGIMASGAATAGAWSGGSVGSGSGGTAYSVGGTVSGLSGTVVLQDNGADTLSVSANGSFAFGTQLAGGAAYAVTVQANPSGQTCTVSNGSGTVGSANVTNVAVSCAAASGGGGGGGAGETVIGSDSFNRANGALGAGWTDDSDGGLSIVSDQVSGNGGNSGDLRTGESYPSDQFSQLTVGSTPLSGSQWIGPAVRMQASGQSAYVGFYYWNSGSPVLMLFLRKGGNWEQLGSTYNSGALPAGTQLQVTAVGSTITLLENGVARVTATDSNLSGGAPGIMASGAATAGAWSGGSVGSGSGGTAYSVGGTVSGLSGTVVLQDNGADTLSVSANGSFAFGTQLAGGAAYAVTVQANPSGQTCTVSNGSGTVGSANVTNVAVSCAAASGGGGGGGAGETVIGSDSFNRANGALGAGWTDDSDGGLSIVSDQVSGNGGNSGDLRTGESYPSDQFSQLTVGSTPLSGSQWIGPAVRMQASGQSAYVGFYYWNSGSPVLMLFLRKGGNWEQLGSTYNSGALPAGTQLQVTAVGSTITLLENGVARVTATDSNLSGGAPGIMASGAATAGAWSGGSVGSGSGGTAYSVGGTVSGLSGTVVLQDNGADTLSVSANGSFAFGTQLAGGAAYAVTVQANPSGQTCTVSNGSGTVGSANVTNVAVSCAAASGGGGGGGAGETVIGSDSFNRANGALGAGWTDDSDGGLSIVSDQVSGNGGNSGDLRTGESYPSDQFSQLTVGSTPLSGSQWIGPAVRMQASGQSAYVGFYYWNSGNPEVMLFLRNGGNWKELGAYNSGALASGTQLTLVAVGNTISFQVNGVQRIGVSDGTLTGGAPGILASGAATAGAWSGGSAGFQVSYASTDSNGVKSYSVISANNGDGPQTLRVLTPTNPAAGVAHNFLIVLPVEAGLGSTFGDGLGTLESLDAQDQYNLTIIEPTFAIDSWDANNPNDPRLQYETFLTQELVPWIKQNLATTGHEQTWLIGFSKSGLGVQDLILKHPDLFTLAASWDFPADMATYDGLGSDPAANYGTDANYQANYRLTQAFVDALKAPFLTSNRIWIGGYSLYQTDVSDYGTLLTSEGIAHSTETPQSMSHRWDSGWMPIALAALYQDSLNQ